MEASLQHHFLIAMPSLVDTFFYRTVIYICEHDEDGAMGLIINRPTQITLTELLSHLDIENPFDSKINTPICFGGPVQKSQGMILHDSHADWNSTIQLTDNLFLSTSTDILKAMGSDKAPKNSLITLGFAAWEAGQLEQELVDNSWLTVAADDEVLFNTPADKRWHAAANLLGIDINLMSNLMGHA